MSNYDELIKQVAIIIAGIALILLINWLSGVFSVNPGPSDLPPTPSKISPENLPPPEDLLSR